MRKLLTIAMLLMLATGTQAQKYDTIKVEREASFQGGGINAFTRWLAERVTYPENLRALNAGTQVLSRHNLRTGVTEEVAVLPGSGGPAVGGTVVVQFIVNTDGSLSDIKAVETPHPALTDAVIPVVRRSPKWESAMQGLIVKQGDSIVYNSMRRVRQIIEIPVHFPAPGTQSNVRKFTGKIYDYDEVERPPALTNSEETIFDWFDRRAASSKKLQKAPARTMFVMFVVEPDKSLTGIQLINSPNNAVTNEVRRILATMPQRTPGMVGGENVRTYVTMLLNTGAAE
jgi:hypothetical protein